MVEEHVLVPALVGLDVADAQALAIAARVVTVSDDPDMPPRLTGTVVAQKPRAGTQVHPGDTVTIWVEDGGGDDGGGGGGGGGGSPLPDSPLPLTPSGTKPG
jgi:PASTA domain